MASKRVVFIHHNQGGGRLSFEDATRAWAYVSRRAWQEEPKQLKIKLWEPRENVQDRDETGPSDDQNMIIVPYSNFHQAYASKNCLQHIKLPKDLDLVEQTFSSVYGYNQRYCPPSSHWTAVTISGTDKPAFILQYFEFSIQCGVESLLSRNYTQAFASFEYAARILRDNLSGSVFDSLDCFFTTILPGLLYAQSQNAHDIVQLFLRQINGLATVAGGPMHPLSVAARNLLGLDITPELIDRLIQADLKCWFARQSCGKIMLDNMLFETQCATFGNSFPLQEAERIYRHLMRQEHRTSENGERARFQFTTAAMAELYLKHGKFAEAACAVSNAPDHFAEWVEKGYVATLPNTAPLSITGITMRLLLLAQAFAGQGKRESADATFLSSISAGQTYLRHDNPMLIRARKTYATFLHSQNRSREAEEIEKVVDSGLKMYMLTP